MSIKKIIIFNFSLCYVAVALAAPLWKENFSAGSTMESNGYRCDQINRADKVELQNGEMIFHCTNGPYKGTQFCKKIPFIRRGELSFDIKVNAEKSSNYNHLSLMIQLYDTLLICLNGNTRTLQRYHRIKQNNANIAPFKNNVWYHVAVRFDLDKKTVEYFVDDMDNPVFTDEDFPFDLKKAANGRLIIGNYGLAAGTIVNSIRKIELRQFGDTRVSEKKTETADNISGVIVLRGYCGESYRLADLTGETAGEKVQYFNLSSNGSRYEPVNTLQFDRLPGFSGGKIPRLIVLCDIPFNRTLPVTVKRRMLDAVQNGSDLLILGGPFALNRGEYATSALAEVLPVICGKPFDTRYFEQPVAVDNCPDATVGAIQLVKVRKGAKIKSTAGGAPLVVMGHHGLGQVLVVTGIPRDRKGDFASSASWSTSIAKLLKSQ